MKKSAKNSGKIIFFLVLFMSWLFAGKVYFQSGFPYTHDGENHLARFANYKIAVREGQIPPRFAPNLVNHYGYPVFNYNYPLANILSLPFSFLKINYEIIFKILALSSIGMGLWGINLWLKKLDFSQKSRALAMVVFSLSPYLANLVYFRGNIGELMALNILPWLFYLVEISHQKLTAFQNKKFFVFSSFVWATFLLSHNIAALFGSAIVILYFLLRWISARKKSFFIPSLLTGILLSLWFWLPAIFEKSEIILDDSSFFAELSQHFPTLNQLIFSTLSFGFSKVGSIDGLSFSLGLVPIIFLVIGSLLMLRSKLAYKKVSIFFWVSWLFLLFQLSFTQKIWEIIPLAAYIQFPWRLSLFFSVLILPVVAFSYERLGKNWQKIIILALIINIISIFKLKPLDKFHRNNLDYEAFTLSTSTLNENNPKTFRYILVGDWKPSATVQSGEAIITTELWNGTRRIYSVDVKDSATIIEPTMRFLGWETNVFRSDGEQEHIRKIEYVDSDEIQGRIAYTLEPGSYKIVSKFTQKTWPRVIGNLLSFSSFLGLLIFSIWSRDQKK